MKIITTITIITTTIIPKRNTLVNLFQHQTMSAPSPKNMLDIHPYTLKANTSI